MSGFNVILLSMFIAISPSNQVIWIPNPNGDNVCLSGHNDKTVFVSNLEVCEKLCLEELDFQCCSLEFNPIPILLLNKYQCMLSADSLSLYPGDMESPCTFPYKERNIPGQCQPDQYVSEAHVSQSVYDETCIQTVYGLPGSVLA
ncbi:hypothetical protein CAPTEDRAFT_204389 [Capitella teleta]|uniref:Apple domain-containing protein n=1 Tax=Capitella teleta TaxID=283909 RepID=R7U2J7_CAPTE|nr:hypothetical protein CAPTEDRAFT_204389 [Capitella teleta]|eukprot:ELT97866.1 hypothetical protein CAPTEDRAFT_204389 [Capitella teleta]